MEKLKTRSLNLKTAQKMIRLWKVPAKRVVKFRVAKAAKDAILNSK